jgi:hypothetical protein
MEGECCSVSSQQSLNDVSGRGVVRLYELRGETWESVADPIEGTAPFDHSGRSIALSYNGTRIAFGAPRHNQNSPDDGQVLVFETERRTGDPPTEAPSTAPSARMRRGSKRRDSMDCTLKEMSSLRGLLGERSHGRGQSPLTCF